MKRLHFVFLAIFFIALNLTAVSGNPIFMYDTIYKCPDDMLNAGTASSYKWGYSPASYDGPYTDLNTPVLAIPADKDGYYAIEMYRSRDIAIIRDTVFVRNLDFEASILPVAFSAYEISTIFSASINPVLKNDPNLTFTYHWTFEGGATATPNAPMPTVVWTSRERVARLTLTATANSSGSTGSCSISLQAVAADNISDANCWVTPPATKWDIEEKGISNAAVHYLATPLVGDLDNDGRLEVVVPGGVDAQTSSSVLIFDDELKLKRTIKTPVTPQYGTTNLLIGDVDNDGFGEIIIGTSNRQLMCYSHDGNIKWGPTAAYGAIDNAACPSLIVADINGDGYSEILAVDKIYDGATGTLLVTLPAGGRGYSAGGPSSYMPVFADIDNDGIQEVVAGNTVYKVVITNRNGTAGNSATVFSRMSSMPDGFTSVADIDMDGDLDVIVTAGIAGAKAITYVCDGATANQIGNTITVNSTEGRISRVFVGDITGSGSPDIAFTYIKNIAAFSYNKTTNTFVNLWTKATSDASGATTMSMFDFNQDGEIELVYRDETHLRIINKYGENVTSFECYSRTHTEYPVIVDLDKDGHADILVSGAKKDEDHSSQTYIMRFGSETPNQWASARSVWNQHAYNSVNINEDLSIPRYTLNPATVFPGDDGIIGTNDDVRPYNNFLQQQTLLNRNGTPLWLAPDALLDASISDISVSGNSVTVTAGIINVGDATLGPPVYVTLYKNSVSIANIMLTDSANIHINPRDTGYVTVTIPDITIYNPINIIVRINDAGNPPFVHQLECNMDNNEMGIINPLLKHLVKKEATLLSVQHNGTYPNPVSVLHGENITYEITAVNANITSGTLIITDTIPAYLKYVSNSAVPTNVSEQTTGSTPAQTVLQWTFPNVPSMDTITVSFESTPESGVCASQPLFFNHAWVNASDTLYIKTNRTYHQGAGVSIMSFSAGLGGRIYNATEQAVDYMAAPVPGIIITCEEGYRFVGWSHDSYTSQRGNTIDAKTGIMNYDSLIVYGDMKLHANFEAIEYPITYYLNGSENAKDNPAKYTIESETIILEAPEKDGDTFMGWTGSNAEEPQSSVIIASGSIGELTFYANFLHSGRENDIPNDDIKEDEIWSVKDELYIRTSKAGSIVRIYSTKGVLKKLKTIATAGKTTIKLPKGIYAVTINNTAGQIVSIE